MPRYRTALADRKIREYAGSRIYRVLGFVHEGL